MYIIRIFPFHPFHLKVRHMRDLLSINDLFRPCEMTHLYPIHQQNLLNYVDGNAWYNTTSHSCLVIYLGVHGVNFAQS